MLERNDVRVIGQLTEVLNSLPVEKRPQILAALKQVFRELAAAQRKVAAQGA